MWYCGDGSNNILPYWMIRGSDMIEMKGGIQKLIMMKKLVKNVEKGVRIVDLIHILVQNLKSRHFLDLYHSVKPFFVFPYLNKIRRIEKIVCKTYYNILCDKKACLVGEKVPKN